MFVLALAISLPITWTRLTEAPWTYMDSTNVNYVVHSFVNVGAESLVNPSWTQDCYFPQQVTGGNPTPGPSWTEKFSTLSNGSLGVGYWGGGETIPAHKERRDYVPLAREQGKESWTADESPYAAARNRLWEVPGTITYQLLDTDGGSGDQ